MKIYCSGLQPVTEELIDKFMGKDIWVRTCYVTYGTQWMKFLNKKVDVDKRGFKFVYCLVSRIAQKYVENRYIGDSGDVQKILDSMEGNRMLIDIRNLRFDYPPEVLTEDEIIEIVKSNAQG